ncbi:hypothetical protein D3C75_996280 [compost metagenome]
MGRPDDLLPEQPGVLGHHSLIEALFEASGAGEMLRADGGVGTVAEGSDRLPAPAHHPRRGVTTHGLDPQQAGNRLIAELIGSVAATIAHPSP